MPLNLHPAAIRASAVLNRPRFLDQRRLEFSVHRETRTDSIRSKPEVVMGDANAEAMEADLSGSKSRVRSTCPPGQASITPRCGKRWRW